MKKHIPNTLTILNLISGCLAILFLFRGLVWWMVACVFVSAFFDLLDGMSARLLKVSSPLGKELDSLADMVSFGLLPGLVVVELFQQSDWKTWIAGSPYLEPVRYLPLLITAFSALRLAKFNLDDRQQTQFIGLPTPANTLWIVSLPVILKRMPGQFDFLLLNAPVLLGLVAVSCYLLVAEIPLFSLKMSGFSLEKYLFQYTLLVFSVVAFLVISFAAIPVIIAFYVLLSLIKNYKIKPVK